MIEDLVEFRLPSGNISKKVRVSVKEIKRRCKNGLGLV